MFINFVPKYIYYKTSLTGDSLIRAKVSPFPPTTFVNVLGSGAKPLPNSNDSIVIMEKGMYTFNSTVYFPRNKKLIIKELLSSIGTVSFVSNEEQIDLITAISGSGPAYFF